MKKYSTVAAGALWFPHQANSLRRDGFAVCHIFFGFERGNFIIMRTCGPVRMCILVSFIGTGQCRWVALSPQIVGHDFYTDWIYQYNLISGFRLSPPKNLVKQTGRQATFWDLTSCCPIGFRVTGLVRAIGHGLMAIEPGKHLYVPRHKPRQTQPLLDCMYGDRLIFLSVGSRCVTIAASIQW